MIWVLVSEGLRCKYQTMQLICHPTTTSVPPCTNTVKRVNNGADEFVNSDVNHESIQRIKHVPSPAVDNKNTYKS